MAGQATLTAVTQTQTKLRLILRSEKTDVLVLPPGRPAITTESGGFP